MQLSPALALRASDAAASTTGVVARCQAANFRWESAVSDARAIAYSELVEAPATHEDWQYEHKQYLSSHVQVAKDLPRSAECFMNVNSQAHLLVPQDNNFLIRLESLDSLLSRPLTASLAERFWDRFFNSPKDLRKDKLSHEDETLRSEFVEQWKQQRTQARPLFATFLNDFGGSVDALSRQDWPHILRDRLGMTHWPSTPGKAVPVALMCFTVSEVVQARLLAGKIGAVAELARPTVLDAEMSAAFIPAPFTPGAGSYGHTLDLANLSIPTDFTPELLAFPLDYLPRHIKALGYVVRPHTLHDDAATLAARNRHIQGLRQRLPDFGAFGEVLT